MGLKTVRLGDKEVSYDDSSEMHKAVFDHVMAWFHKTGSYSGESIMQSDAPQITAAPMLSDLADDVIGFDVKWDGE